MDAATSTAAADPSRTTCAAAAGAFVPLNTWLSPHFSVAEFVHSDTALRLGLDNRLPERLLADARRTCEMLERCRELLSDLAGTQIPIYLSSGYRCLTLNRHVGSKDSSDHLIANAADWTAPDFGTPFEIATKLAPFVGTLGIGQLIHEFGGWVHTGRRIPIDSVNRVITIDSLGTREGILPARQERRH